MSLRVRPGRGVVPGPDPEVIDLTRSDKDDKVEDEANGAPRRLPGTSTPNNTHFQENLTPKLVNGVSERKSQVPSNAVPSSQQMLRVEALCIPGSFHDSITVSVAKNNTQTPQNSSDIHISAPSSSPVDRPASFKKKSLFRPPPALNPPANGDHIQRSETPDQSPDRRLKVLIAKTSPAKIFDASLTKGQSAKISLYKAPLARPSHSVPSAPSISNGSKRNREESPRNSPSKRQKLQTPVNDSQGSKSQSEKGLPRAVGPGLSQCNSASTALIESSTSEKRKDGYTFEKKQKAAQQGATAPSLSSSSTIGSSATTSPAPPSSRLLLYKLTRPDGSPSKGKENNTDVPVNKYKGPRKYSSPWIESTENGSSVIPDRSVSAPRSLLANQASTQPLPTRTRSPGQENVPASQPPRKSLQESLATPVHSQYLTFSKSNQTAQQIENARLEAQSIPLSLKAIKGLWAELLEDAALQHREQTKLLIRRARISEKRLLKEQAARHQEAHKFDPDAWYCTMKSIATAPHPAAKSKFLWVNTRQFTQRVDLNGSKIQVTQSAPITRIKPPNIAVPSYNTYVGIDRSILTESNDRLLSHPLPLLDGDQMEEQLTEELPKIYSFSQTQFDRRAPRLRHDHQQKHLAPYVKRLLRVLQISDEDVLYMFFTNQSIPSESDNFERLLTNSDPSNWPLPRRPKFEQPQPSSLRKWVLHRLEKPSLNAIAYAALACAAIDQLRDVNSGFNSWEYFRRSPVLVELLRNPIPDPLRVKQGGAGRHSRDSSESSSDVPDGQEQSSQNLGKILCRICHLYNCGQHGQIIPSYNQADDSENESDPEEFYLSDYEGFRIQNIRKPVVSISPKKIEGLAVPVGKHKTKRDGLEKDRVLDRRDPFYPCDHEGPCSKARGCPCAQAEISCEKYCGCPKSCERRFSGCSCAKKGKLCSGEKCRCFIANRECDPDLCGACGVIEVLDPVHRNADPEWLAKRCRNCYVQRNIPKRTLIGTSAIHGFGLFAGEDIHANEFVGEYKGEILAHPEGERRAHIDYYRQYSYLFALNPKQDVDSMTYGNKIRFINDPTGTEWKQNCYPKTLLCSTVLRLGMFAQRDIKTGEELFFPYGDTFAAAYKQATTQKRGKKGKGTAKAMPVKSKKGTARKNTRGVLTASSSRGTPSSKKSRSRATSQASTVPPSEATTPGRMRRKLVQQLAPTHTNEELASVFEAEPEEAELDEVEVRRLDALVDAEDDADFEDEDMDEEVDESEDDSFFGSKVRVSVSPQKGRKRGRSGDRF